MVFGRPFFLVFQAVEVAADFFIFQRVSWNTKSADLMQKTSNTTASGHFLCFDLTSFVQDPKHPLEGGKHQKVLKSMSKRHLGKLFF